MKKVSARQVIALPFYKVHGAGNDMLVFFAKHLSLAGRKKKNFIQQLAHRNLGIGSDQIVEVLSSKPLAIQIWNCDGSKAEMCANGSRSFLFLASKEGWIDPRLQKVPLKVSGEQYSGLKFGNTYELSLGKPKILGQKKLKLGAASIPFWDVNVGNPHAVIFTKGSAQMKPWKAPKNFDYKEYGKVIEGLKIFPHKTNVEFVRGWKKKKNWIEVDVQAWERGAGATQSCGSGAVAVAVLFHEFFGEPVIKIRMTNFLLQVRFDEGIAYLSGPCDFVGKGTYLVGHSG